MSRNVGQKIDRPDREQQRREKEKGRLLITSFPPRLGRMSQPDRMLAALIQKDRLTALQTFSLCRAGGVGSIYLGKVKKMLRNANACFVEIANQEQCFLDLEELEKFPPFVTNRNYNDMLLEGDELLVQIAAERIKNKLPRVTTRIVLEGNYFVFAVGTAQLGISQKLGTVRRQCFKDMMKKWQIVDADGIPVQEKGVPPFSLVVRTQAGPLATREDCGESIMRPEYEELRRRFISLFLRGRHRACFSCLLGGGTALPETFRYFPFDEYEEVVTDLPQVYAELLKQQQESLYLGEKELRLYQDPELSLNKLYGLEAKIRSALNKKVWLDCGGNLVIEQTESLTAIDVNSGKYTADSGDNVRENALRRVNLEAAREVIRQIRLRSLSGIIIVDFINPANLDQEKELLQELRELAQEDPVPVYVVDITPLGLAEITRRKIVPSLREQLGQEV